VTILLGGTAYPALTVSVYFGWFQHNRQCRAVATYFLSKSKKSFLGPQCVCRGSKEYFWIAHYQLYRVIFAIQWLMKVRFLGPPSVNDCQTLSVFLKKHTRGHAQLPRTIHKYYVPKWPRIILPVLSSKTSGRVYTWSDRRRETQFSCTFDH